MSVALRGNLRDFGIADVFQLIGQQRKTGVLEFKREDEDVVQLRFDRGAVVSAAPVPASGADALAEMLVRCGLLTRRQIDDLAPECEASAQTIPRLALGRGWLASEDLDRVEDLLTRETFFEVLRWESGEFDFRAQSVEHGRNFEALLGAEQILMDGLRMMDEWHSFSELVPSLDTVFQRMAGFEEYRSRTRLDPSELADAERLYQLVDGRIPVQRIVDLSLLGSFDAVRLLADLRRTEVVEPLDPDAMRGLQTRPRVDLGMTRSRVISAIAGAAALGGLALLLVLGDRVAPGEEPRVGVALRQSPRAAVREAFETRRVRHALEAYRIASGRWPARLEELERQRLLPAGSLAAQAGRPYYYSVRGDGALLLAPER